MKHKFDPMTGEPIHDNNNSNIISYDPMTGEPIYGNDNSSIIGYDPMTGEPIYGNDNSSIIGYDPMTGEPVYGDSSEISIVPRKRKAGKIILGIAATIVIAGSVVFAGFKSGMFLSTPKKVLLAIANTATDTNHLTEDLQSLNLLTSDEFTASIDMAIEDAIIRGDITKGKSHIQVNLDEDTIESFVGIPGIGGTLDIDKEEVKLSVPSVSNKLFTYNYRNKKNGYLVDEAEEEFELIDQILCSLFDEKDQNKITGKTTKALMDIWSNLDFKKAETEIFEVNGKDRKCKGYETEITSDTLYDFISVIDDICAEYYGTFYDDYLGNAFDDFYDSLDYMEDISTTFYICKNKLACVHLNADNENMDICFLGGDTRWQNIEVLYDDEEFLSIEGKTRGSEELMELRLYGEKAAEFSYDYKNGDFSFFLNDYDEYYNDYNECCIEGTLTSDKKGVTLTVDDFTYDDKDIPIEMTLAVTKGASFKKLDGKIFDIGEASEDDLYDLNKIIRDAVN